METGGDDENEIVVVVGSIERSNVVKMDGDNDGNEIMASVYHRSGKTHQISKKIWVHHALELNYF
jgi:hypothetical protein